MKDILLSPITVSELEILVQNSLRKVLSETSLPATQPEKDKLITIQEASDVLNLAVQTIYGLVWAKKIPFYKQGKKLTFSRDELIKWRMAVYSPVGQPVNEIVDDTLKNVRRKKK